MRSGEFVLPLGCVVGKPSWPGNLASLSLVSAGLPMGKNGSTLPCNSNFMVFPTLDLSMQATELIEPVIRWGSIARSSQVSGTYYFYEDDYKFSALHRHPDQLPASGCRVAVEPNYSTWSGMGEGAATATIARKRWLARHWQH